jgi:hypothetical protein
VDLGVLAFLVVVAFGDAVELRVYFVEVAALRVLFEELAIGGETHPTNKIIKVKASKADDKRADIRGSAGISLQSVIFHPIGK